MGSALATSGTVSVGYDGASGDASKKLKFEGSFSNQTQAAGPAANPSSGTTAMNLNVATSDGLKVVGNKVEVKFSGPLTNLDAGGSGQELADFEVYYRDPGADSNLFTADDTIEAAIPTAVAAKGSDSIEMTFSSGDAAKITDNTLSGFEFFGNNGSVTNGSNQLTIGGSAKDVALSVRGDMSGDIVGVGPVIQAPNTGPITVDIKFPADITSTTFDKTKYTVKTGYDYGKLDNAVGTNPGDPSMATVDSVAKHSTDASTLTLTLSGNVADKDYATVTVTDTVPLASYSKQVYTQGADVSSASKNLDLSAAPAATTGFTEGTKVGFGTTADNTFQLATGAFDSNTPAGAANYTAFGGAGNDVASSIDSADVFIGGTGVDTAKVLFGFQDYKFDDVALVIQPMMRWLILLLLMELENWKNDWRSHSTKADLLNLTLNLDD